MEKGDKGYPVGTSPLTLATLPPPTTLPWNLAPSVALHDNVALSNSLALANSVALVSADNGIHANNVTYTRNWSVIFRNPGGGQAGQMDGLQYFVDMMDWYYTPSITAFGVITNLLTLVIIHSSQMKWMSMTPFMAAMSASDSMYLLTSLLNWMYRIHGLNYICTPGVCQLSWYIVFVCSFLSIWYIICIQVDRYLSLWHISRRPLYVSNRRCKCLAALLAILTAMLYGIILWTSDVIHSRGQPVCTVLPKYAEVLKVFTLVDTLLSAIMPYSMLPVLNILILVQIIIKCVALRRHASPDEDTDECLDFVDRARAQIRSTASFLLITSLIWLLNLASQATRISDFFKYELNKPVTRKEYLYQQIFSYPYMASYAVKFMLYLLFSSLFRDSVLECCKHCRCSSCCCCSPDEQHWDIPDETPNAIVHEAVSQL